jgi:hypothetical protein
MLGVLTPIGGGGDWIAADETRLYLRNPNISYKPTQTYTSMCMNVCVIIEYIGMRENIWDVARCDL